MGHFFCWDAQHILLKSKPARVRFRLRWEDAIWVKPPDHPIVLLHSVWQRIQQVACGIGWRQQRNAILRKHPAFFSIIRRTCTCDIRETFSFFPTTRTALISQKTHKNGTFFSQFSLIWHTHGGIYSQFSTGFFNILLQRISRRRTQPTTQVTYGIRADFFVHRAFPFLTFRSEPPRLHFFLLHELLRKIQKSTGILFQFISIFHGVFTRSLFDIVAFYWRTVLIGLLWTEIWFYRSGPVWARCNLQPSPCPTGYRLVYRENVLRNNITARVAFFYDLFPSVWTVCCLSFHCLMIR